MTVGVLLDIVHISRSLTAINGRHTAIIVLKKNLIHQVLLIIVTGITRRKKIYSQA